MKLFLFFFLFSTFVFADCTTTNLITEPNSPFQKIPVYDQDGNGICYGYVAAQLMNYHLIKHGNEPKVHPLWPALKFSEGIKDIDLHTGIASNAIKAVRFSGNCDGSLIARELAKWAKKANITEARAINLLDKFAPRLKKLDDEKKRADSSAILLPREVNNIINQVISEEKPYCGAGATLEELIPDLKELAVMDATQLFGYLMLPACMDGLEKLTVPDPKYKYIVKDGDVSPIIEENIASTKGPLAIQYCSKSIKQHGAVGLTRPSDPKGLNEMNSNCEPHESLIVGKKEIGGKCHFLLRNSWGSGFSSATKNWKCFCKEKSSGKFFDDCTNETHNNGKYQIEACWIDSETLNKNVLSVTTMEQN